VCENAFSFWIRVARWGIFNPKIQTWVNFGGSCIGRCWYILCPFVIFYGHIAHLVYFLVSWYAFPILVSCSKKNLATLFWIECDSKVNVLRKQVSKESVQYKYVFTHATLDLLFTWVCTDFYRFSAECFQLSEICRYIGFPVYLCTLFLNSAMLAE
jgi:hypothetical protein